jgi:hypothetical protein
MIATIHTKRVPSHLQWIVPIDSMQTVDKKTARFLPYAVRTQNRAAAAFML